MYHPDKKKQAVDALATANNKASQFKAQEQKEERRKRREEWQAIAKRQANQKIEKQREKGKRQAAKAKAEISKEAEKDQADKKNIEEDKKIEQSQKQKTLEELFQEILPEAVSKANAAEDAVETAVITAEMIAVGGDDLDFRSRLWSSRALGILEETVQGAQTAIGEARIFLGATQAAAKGCKSKKKKAEAIQELGQLQQQLQEAQQKLVPLKNIWQEFVQRKLTLSKAVCSTFGGFEDLSKGSHWESGIGGSDSSRDSCKGCSCGRSFLDGRRRTEGQCTQSWESDDHQSRAVPWRIVCHRFPGTAWCW